MRSIWLKLYVDLEGQECCAQTTTKAVDITFWLWLSLSQST